MKTTNYNAYNKKDTNRKGTIEMRLLQKIILLVVFAVFAYAFAAVDLDPRDNGSTMARNVTGSAYEASFYNPAILGVDRPPRGGILLFPLSDLGVGYWSDKLALSPFRPYWEMNNPDSMSKQLSHILAESFDITDADMADPTGSKVSKKLTDGLKGGFDVYGGGRTSLFSLAHNRVAFDVTTHMDEQLHMPEGPLYMLFSDTKGLLRGNTLDFSKFKQEAVWATDFTFSVGLPVIIPELQKFFKMKYGAGGLAVKYVMGHSYLKAEMEKGTLSYNSGAADAIALDGRMRIQTAGTGMHGDYLFDNPFQTGLPISGHGIGVNIGGILYDDDATISVNFQNLGVLFWMNKTREVQLDIRKNDLRFYEIMKAVEGKKQPSGLGASSLTIFNRNEDEYLSGSSDTLKESNGFVTSLPLTLEIGYSYKWDFLKLSKNTGIKYLAEYALIATNYQQSLAPGPGMSYLPRLSIGSEVGVLNGFVPLRMGLFFGGPELVGSALGMGFNFRYFSLHGSYKAIGTPWFVPTRGVELAGAININWGVKPLPKKVAPVVVVSKCPFIPPVGYDYKLGLDSCPDPDQDHDSICDPWVAELQKSVLYSKICHGSDKCPTQAEDKDGFEDEDGCPDFDNDKDGIPDSLDKCPNAAEDKDGFEDQDGCPDYDNDKDGIPDSLDKCINDPEDKDGFKDFDGCPDLDNDNDGIKDIDDKCPNEPETFNGYKDDDGCPDTVARPTVKEEKALNKALRAINFKSGSAELTEDSYSALMAIVSFLKQYPFLKYEIQGHTDSKGNDDYNLLLSAARAASVRYYLVSQTIPDSTVIAIGYGKTRPIASNNTAEGRALNRRVEFKVIETADEYQRLKALEADFKERVRSAQIKGAKY
jgi:outer membrane protein OmpA-like peptidoglycan-associated protein